MLCILHKSAVRIIRVVCRIGCGLNLIYYHCMFLAQTVSLCKRLSALIASPFPPVAILNCYLLTALDLFNQISLAGRWHSESCIYTELEVLMSCVTTVSPVLVKED